MSDRHRIAALCLGLVFGGLLFALGPRPLAAQRPQTTEPPIAPPRGIPGVRDVPSSPPGVRDVPAPATPPRVRITPAPGVGDVPVRDGTYCPVDPPAPVVSIKVRVPACAPANEELDYRLCVENHGRAPAHHVVVRDPLPANATFVRADPPPSASDPILEWRLGTLDACARREIVLVLKPTGTGDVKNCARVQFEHGECVVTKIGAPPLPPAVGQGRLQLRKTGPAQAVLHNPIAFKLVVTNPGTAAVPGVELTDTMPEGMEDGATGKSQLTWSVGTLAPGESRSYEYQAITKKTGRLCNRAVATTGTLRDEAEACVEVREAKLRIEKTGPKAQYVKLPATYQITVTNDGATPLSNVVVADTWPEKTKLVRMTEGGQIRGKQVEWLLGDLPPGRRQSVQITLQATEAGRAVNQASARAEGLASVSAEFATEFESAAGLTFYVEIADNPVEVKMPTRYTITVVNQGNAAATGIELSADVPSQMEIKEVRPKDSGRQLGQQITFNRLELLEAGGTKAFVIEVVPTRAAADARLKVKMTTKELPEGVTREVPVNVVPNGEPPEAR
jgi:uncharacterized repeat protein (TIGR01451 family)